MRVRVGFSTSRSLQSRIIRWLTRSTVSHTFLIVEGSFLGSDLVVEADIGGVRMQPLSAFEKKNDIIEIIPMPYTIHVGMGRIGDWLNDAYDFPGLFGTVFVLLGRKLKTGWRNPFNTKALFCSEMVVRVLSASGYPNAKLLIPSSTTPKDLLDFLHANTTKVRMTWPPLLG